MRPRLINVPHDNEIVSHVGRVAGGFVHFTATMAVK